MRRIQRIIRRIGLRGGVAGSPGSDAGMSTAEYAVGTVAACGFGALLYKILTSDQVRQLLTGIIERALNLTF